MAAERRAGSRRRNLPRLRTRAAKSARPGRQRARTGRTGVGQCVPEVAVDGLDRGGAAFVEG